MRRHVRVGSGASFFCMSPRARDSQQLFFRQDDSFAQGDLRATALEPGDFADSFMPGDLRATAFTVTAGHNPAAVEYVVVAAYAQAHAQMQQPLVITQWTPPRYSGG